MAIRSKHIAIQTTPRAAEKSPAVESCGELAFVAQPSNYCFDWSRASFVSIAKVAALTQFSLYQQARGGRVRDVGMSGAGYRYACEMGYPSPSRGVDVAGTSSAVPMARLLDDEDVSDATFRIHELLSARDEISESACGTVAVALSEMMDNVVTHAESDVGGLVGVQWFPAARKLEMVVVDSGIGIPASLRHNPANRGKKDAELLASAFCDGVGELVLPDFDAAKQGAGHGLFAAAGLVRGLGGHLSVVSRGTALRITKDAVVPLSHLFYPGTLFELVVPIPVGAFVDAAFVRPDLGSGPFLWSPTEGGYTEEDALW